MTKLATLLANADRVSPEIVEASVVAEDFHVFPGTTYTVCLLTLMNGHHVSGFSACVNPENFDEEIGRDLARENAENKIWQVLGTILRDMKA